MLHIRLIHVSDKVLHEGDVDRVVLPGVLGEFEISEGHIAIVALLASGEIAIHPTPGKDAALKEITIEQGLMRFDGRQLQAVVE